jgi:hypothetical protein
MKRRGCDAIGAISYDVAGVKNAKQKPRPQKRGSIELTTCAPHWGCAACVV